MKSKLCTLIAAASICTVTGTGTAVAGNNDIVLSPSLAQSEFNSFVDELGTAVAYNPLSPAGTLGITGFEVGLSVTAVDIDKTLWNKVVSDSNAPSALVIPRLMARKGLPFGMDVGVSYLSGPDTNISVFGGELRKSLLTGTPLSPSMSIIGHASRLNGVDSLDLSTYGVDLGISKKLPFLTPYAAIGQVWYSGKENIGLGLANQDTSETRGYLGLRVGMLPLMSITAQADFAIVNSYSVKFDLGF